MGKVYTIAMNKGGVGKTSLLTNLASVIAERMPEKRVLVIDTDGQGNTTLTFGQNPNDIMDNMYDVLVGNATFDDVKISVSENIDIVPSNRDMNFCEMDILTDLKKYPKVFELLKKHIESIIDDYDYVFIDTPPSLGLVTLNALKVADEVIIPFVPEAYSTHGLLELIDAINDFKETENPQLKIAGVVGMMIQPVNLHTNLMQEIRKWCTEKEITCFDTKISKSIRFAEAVAEQGSPAIWFDKHHKIVKQYYDLADEILGDKIGV